MQRRSPLTWASAGPRGVRAKVGLMQRRKQRARVKA
jgi:hypothetical protein